MQYDDTNEDVMMKPTALYVNQNIKSLNKNIIFAVTYGNNVLF